MSTSDLSLSFSSRRLGDAFARLVEKVRQAHGQIFVVGGSARDAVLGKPATELDLEVFDLEEAALLEALRPEFNPQQVGQHFPVIRLRGYPVDIACASGSAHHLEEAALRRDFTCNALYLNPESGELHDPLGGVSDLKAHVLRHCGSRFSDDPLRILRGMQLAARFDLTAAPETLEFCQSLSLEGIAPERLFEEWRKLLVSGHTPSLGLRFLEASGGLAFFPELEALRGCPQDPEFHPEGDVWIHTLHALDAFAQERTGDAREDLVVGLAVLGHDLGKPDTSVLKQGDETGTQVRSPGHDQKSAELTRQFLGGMTQEHKLIEEAAVLIQNHMAPAQLQRDNAGDAAIRRLARKVERIDRLVRVSLADHRGRPPRVPDSYKAGGWLLERAEHLAVLDAAPEAIVKGRDLLAAGLGLQEGEELGRILGVLYEAQLDGRVTSREDGIILARKTLKGQ